jgi:hypothetical protein
MIQPFHSLLLHSLLFAPQEIGQNVPSQGRMMRFYIRNGNARPIVALLPSGRTRNDLAVILLTQPPPVINGVFITFPLGQDVLRSESGRIVGCHEVRSLSQVRKSGYPKPLVAGAIVSDPLELRGDASTAGSFQFMSKCTARLNLRAEPSR